MISTFSVFTILGGLSIIVIGFWLILDTDSLIGDTSNTSEGVTLGDVAKRITTGAAIVGGVAILFGILGILVAKM